MKHKKPYESPSAQAWRIEVQDPITNSANDYEWDPFGDGTQNVAEISVEYGV